MRSAHLCLAILSSALVSCVSTGKYKAAQQETLKYDSLYTWSQRTLKTSQDANNELTKQKTALQDKTNSMALQLNASQENITMLRKQLKDLSALSSAQAESISKSLDNIGAKDAFNMEMRSVLAHRDSVNMAVLLNMKAFLGGYGQKYVDIKVEKGIIYVDLSDTLLFNGDSSSYTVTEKAKQVLGRLARVLNNQPDLEFRIEGQMDSVFFLPAVAQVIPLPQDSLPKDSLQQDSLLHTIITRTPDTSLNTWNIAVQRGLAVATILQRQYNISPARMTAAGRLESVSSRRTRIIILPQLDPLFLLLDRGKTSSH